MMECSGLCHGIRFDWLLPRDRVRYEQYVCVLYCKNMDTSSDKLELSRTFCYDLHFAFSQQKDQYIDILYEL